MSKGEAMPQTTKISIDGKSIVASVDEFFGANCLRVTAGTNCPHGGGSGNGGRGAPLFVGPGRDGRPEARGSREPLDSKRVFGSFVWGTWRAAVNMVDS